MAYRMQSSVPELMDSPMKVRIPSTLWGRCPRARNLAACLNVDGLPSGVRNIQIFHRGCDAHGNLPAEHESQCKDIDQGLLIKDLKQRGMLEDTLVVWVEFGRTVYCQEVCPQRIMVGIITRDASPSGARVVSVQGITYGRTDDYGYNIGC